MGVHIIYLVLLLLPHWEVLFSQFQHSLTMIYSLCCWHRVKHKKSTNQPTDYGKKVVCLGVQLHLNLYIFVIAGSQVSAKHLRRHIVQTR